MASELTAAFDPKAWIAQSRADLLAAAGVEAQDLVRAVRRHRRLLNAKKIQHFAHEGVVTDSRTDDDGALQLRAVELLYDVLGVKAPRQAPALSAIGVEMVIAPDGSVRIRAGSATTTGCVRPPDNEGSNA